MQRPGVTDQGVMWGNVTRSGKCIHTQVLGPGHCSTPSVRIANAGTRMRGSGIAHHARMGKCAAVEVRKEEQAFNPKDPLNPDAGADGVPQCKTAQ